MARRRARSDSTYIIYEMSDARGETYIGVTRKTESTVDRSVRQRWRRHLSRARCEQRDWTLYQYLRSGALEGQWWFRVLETLRGRLAAYRREIEVVAELEPTLNDQYRDRG